MCPAKTLHFLLLQYTQKEKKKNVHANEETAGDSDITHTVHSVPGHKHEEETDLWVYSQVTNTTVC